MTDCRVVCRTCRNKSGNPRRWLWLCETCAQECQEQHKRETGHDTDLVVIPDSIEELMGQAAPGLRRLGW